MENIGKYEIKEELGKGGMGVVYKAHDPQIGRDVAIKVILDRALDIPEIKARFHREAKTAGKLSHENITVVFEFGEHDGKTFIVMEYLGGRDLRTIIETKDSLSLETKLDFARQICRGLQYAHNNDVVHRDIKPENIKVLDNGKVKIIDFGIAKPVTSAEQGTVLTQIGMRVGSPWYMSPEQIKGTNIDQRSDIFSFGVLLYEFLTYKKPFEGDDTTVLYKIMHEEPERINLKESGLVDELQHFLSRCLDKNPENRYQNCTELLRDLSKISDRAQQEKKISQLLAEAVTHINRSQYQEAILKYNEILNIDPNHAGANASIKKLIAREKETSNLRVLSGQIAGTTVSHFKIIDKLGGGGMGVVYKAEDITLKRTVALKFLSPDLTRDEMAKKRFFNEAQTASALDHPNICTIHEISETDDGLLFICMTYYGRETLKDRMQKGRIDLAESLRIIMKIGRGLAKAHENGIVHRDIKPANIIVTPDEEIKIVDFGLAKLTGNVTGLTQTGTTMGTVPYMSPEQVKGIEIDHRTDIWSLGVLLYELITGELPFKGDYQTAILYAIVNHEVTPISQLGINISPDIDKIIERALKKDLHDRYASMHEILNELESLIYTGLNVENTSTIRPGELPPTVRDIRTEQPTVILETESKVSETPKPKPVAKKKSSGGMLVAAMVLIIAGFAAGGWYFYARDSGTELAETPPATDEIIVEPEESTPPETNLADAASVMKEQMLDLKSEAENLEAGKLAEKTFASALQEEERGNNEFANGNFTTSKDMYSSAADLFRKAMDEAQNAAVAAEEDLGKIQKMVADVKQSMLTEKKAAERAQADQFAADVFKKADASERAAEKQFSTGGKNSLLAAQRDFTGARDLYRKAREDADDLKSEQTAARKAKTGMDNVKNQVPGNANEKRQSADYAKAEKAEATGLKQLQDGDFLNAQKSFSQAQSLYGSAADEVVGLSRSSADDAKTAMRNVKSQIGEQHRQDAKYRGALAIESEAEALYDDKKFAEAAAQYQKAETAYSQVRETLDQQKQFEMAARQTFEDIQSKLQASFANRDVKGLTDILNLSKDDQKLWSTFFKDVTNLEATVESQVVDINLKEAMADFSIKMSYTDGRNRGQQNNLRYSWTLQNQNGNWNVAEIAVKN